MLASLPQELLDEITALLRPGDLARLMAVNHQLFLRIEPLVYSLPDAANQAMFWACRTGQAHFIQRLVLVHGAPVSTVLVHGAPLLTLDIAAARGHLEAFRLLLNLGARVDVPGQAKRNHRMLIKHVSCAATSRDLLRLFFEAGLDAQLRPAHHPSFILGKPLMWLVRTARQSPLEQVRLLLQRGAGVFANEPYEAYRHYFLTPFTAAMYQRHYDPIPLLDLLVSAGVSVRGPEIAAPVARPTHVPIFVAVEAMATTGNTALVEWCLRNGANINQQVPLIDHEIDNVYYYGNPALFYIERIRLWNFTGKVAAGTNNLDIESKVSNPLQGLMYLVERGALIDPARDAHDGRPRTRTPTEYTNKPTPWCLERLLRNCGLDCIRTTPTFRSTVEYLLRRSIHRGDVAELLVRCEYALRPGYEQWSKWSTPTGYKAQSEQTIESWRDLLQLVDSLLDEQRSESTPTRLLAEYITCKAQRLDALHEIGHLTIDHLLAHGADINAPAGEPDGATPLHQLCRAYNAHGRTRSALWYTRQTTVDTDMQELVRHLLSKGADPLRTAQGYTPRELLVADIRSEGCSSSESTVLGVAEIF
ncbi:uncharacterized protein DSM5745_06299 [Aspergillus mulundensis]|uniref:F-box domain-containing protein n=1 Tax=Aspergillus mulundensis TaxID=1810919 RepID=A0A3D8RQE9_9EURO|nr:hypothetical protein DSM5745_06299 [Aspergillus mulundensis]RDW76307.1 hypothetical protein DSM5745_06299 [Aspergillus mulundensis]